MPIVDCLKEANQDAVNACFDNISPWLQAQRPQAARASAHAPTDAAAARARLGGRQLGLGWAQPCALRRACVMRQVTDEGDVVLSQGAINGFLGLLKAFVEYGHCDPLDVAEPLGCLFDAKVGGRVRAGRSHGVAAAP